MENIKYNEIKLNEVTVRGYDVHRRYGTDWVTEFTFISENSLTLDQFQIILDGQAYGCLTFIKKVMNFANGKKLYKHICKAVMF